MIQIKSPAEIEAMKEACRISALALQKAGEVICPGMTTKQLDKILYDVIVQAGAKPNFLGLYGFPGTACISINDEVIHGIPGSRKIHEGDVVSVDTGAAIHGFNGDNAYTFEVGAVDPKTHRLLEVTKRSLELGIAAAQPGARLGDVGAAIQTYVEANGFSVVRQYVGHGVGRELHEDPEVPNYGTPGRGVRLVPGMTIAIEPMINAGTFKVHTEPNGWTVKTEDGAPSAHFEHTILITANGPVVLTKP